MRILVSTARDRPFLLGMTGNSYDTMNQKIASYVEDMERRGVRRNTSAPPVFRMLWRLGVNIPPPLFLSFGALFVLSGSTFGLLWGIFMQLFVWRFIAVPTSFGAVGSVACGIAFGLIFAGYYAWKAKRLQLPRWADYIPPESHRKIPPNNQ